MPKVFHDFFGFTEVEVISYNLYARNLKYTFIICIIHMLLNLHMKRIYAFIFMNLNISNSLASIIKFSDNFFIHSINCI